MEEQKYGYSSSAYDPRQSVGYPQQYLRTSFPPQHYGITAPQQQYSASQQQMSTALENTQILTGEGFKPLSRQEREEAARIAAQTNFTFDGYQVVRREFFSHKFDPALTIRNNSIIFNNACISKMDEVVYVQVLINPDSGKLVIRPCEEGARDAVRWCIAKDEKRKSRQISCSMFTAKLYDMMGWSPEYRYKMQGSKIEYRGEHLWVFDLFNTEVFVPSVQDSSNPDDKPKRKQIARYHADWRDSYGIPVAEHDESVKINLDEGFDTMGVNQPTIEQVPMEMIDQETGEVTTV